MTIGERIAKCRKEKNLSQEYVAEILDVSRQAVSKWETNQTEPDTGNLIALARMFGVSVEYLANGEEEKQKVVYVEKLLPMYKIIGIVLLALGGLALLLGTIMPPMLGIGMVVAALGILLIVLKKDGLILGGVIIAIGTVLFLIQGLFFGIDEPIMCLIAAISVGLPVLTYSIIKLVRKIKEEGAIKKLKNHPALIKRIVIVAIVAVLVATAIIIPASIENKKRRSAFAKAMWFSSDRLSEYMLEGLPAPNNANGLNLNSEKILLHFDGDGFNAYLKNVYTFLIRKNFKHLGTRGAFEDERKDTLNWSFIRCDKGPYNGSHNYREFSGNENPDDYYFIYSNSDMDEVTGEIDCYIIHIQHVGESTAVANGRRFTYNVEMSIYRENAMEGYKYPSYDITYDEDYAYFFLEGNPTESIAGKEIKVRRKKMYSGWEVHMDGKVLEYTFANEEYWEYTFIMPDHDVNIEIVIVET